MKNEAKKKCIVNPKYQTFLGLALANLQLKTINEYEFNLVISKLNHITDKQDQADADPLYTEQHAEEISVDLLSDEVVTHFIEDLLADIIVTNASEAKVSEVKEKYTRCKKAIEEYKKDIPEGEMSMIVTSGDKIISWMNTLEAYEKINDEPDKTVSHIFASGVQVFYGWIFKGFYPIFNIERRAMERNAAEKRHSNVIQFIN